MNQNRFAIPDLETYDKVFPAITTEEAARLSDIERHRLYMSLDDIKLFQAVLSTYLEISDPESQEHKRVEYWGFSLERFKSSFKKVVD